MTGRELIIYILANKLEDEQIFEDGVFAGFMTIGKAAELLQVGTETVKVMIQLDIIKNVIKIGDECLIPESELTRKE